MRPRLVLADDHTLVLEGFRRILEDEFDVIGCAEDGRTLLDLAATLHPDAVVLDISMPRLNGIEAARQLRQTSPGTKIVFTTVHADADYVSEAFRAGGSAYLVKRSAARELTVAVKEALRGGSYVTPMIGGAGAGSGAEAEAPSTLFRRLTPRQREVLQLVAEGMSAKQIAVQLHVSRKTVEFHKATMCRTLGLRTTADLVRYAVESGLVGK